MFSLAVGLQDAASLLAIYLGCKGFLVLSRMTVRAVTREDASTESGVLPKQRHGSFYTQQGGQGESTIAVYRLGQGIFSVFVTGNLRIHFLIVEHICRINLVGYLPTMNIHNRV